MRDCDVIVLSKFPEIFQRFLESMKNETDTGIVVLDNPKLSQPCGPGWFGVNVYRPFNMAHNGNIGLRYAAEDCDVLYSGDDVRIVEPETIKRLQAIAYSDPAIGILSPRIQGLCAGQPTEFGAPLAEVDFIGFVFIYIKREVIDRIGYLDERFEGYGWDDLDYCYRARLAGFKIAVARDVTVKHGVDGHVYGSTFIRVKGEEQMAKEDAANRARFAEKWGLPNEPSAIFRAIHDLSATIAR